MFSYATKEGGKQSETTSVPVAEPAGGLTAEALTAPTDEVTEAEETDAPVSQPAPTPKKGKGKSKFRQRREAMRRRKRKNKLLLQSGEEKVTKC